MLNMLKHDMLKHALHYGKLFLGSAIYAVAFSFFYYPNGLVTGGITGIATVINYLTGILPVGIMIIILNVPIFLLGFWKLGLKFMVDSAAAMVFISVLMDIFESFAIPATNDPLLAAIFGGLIAGFGIGLAFSTGATTGGSDIVVRLVRRRYQHINIGHIVLIIDIAVLLTYAVIFKFFDLAMISAIAIYIATKVIDGVLYGINYGKLAYIISEKHDEIGKTITTEMNRGVTMLYGKGAYSGENKFVLMCAIKRRQIVNLKKIVKGIDPNAFIIISETREVLGKGFESIESL